MSIAVSGSPARPSFLLSNAAAYAAGSTTYLGPVRVVGYDTASIEVITDQSTTTFTVRASGADTPAAILPTMTDYRGASAVSHSAIAVGSGAVGAGFVVNFGAAQWLQIALINGSGSTATITVRVTLGRTGGGGS